MEISDDIQTLLNLSRQGSAQAQNELAAKLATGRGVNENLVAAAYWYSESASQGYVDALWNLGSMLIDDEANLGGSYISLGAKLIELAASANQTSACLFLSTCYRNGGRGFDKNDFLASAWDKRAWEVSTVTTTLSTDSLGLFLPAIREITAACETLISKSENTCDNLI